MSDLWQISAFSKSANHRVVIFHWRGATPDLGIIRAKNEAVYFGMSDDLSDWKGVNVDEVTVSVIENE